MTGAVGSDDEQTEGEQVMSRRVMIGLLVLSAVAFLSTEANAGCATIAGKRVCASWITGGSEIGIVTAEGFIPNNGACPDVVSSQGETAFPPPCEFEFCGDFAENIVIQQVPAPVAAVTLRLVGTIDNTPGSPRCGLGPTDDPTCDIRGVVFCGDSGDPKDKHGDKHEDKHTGHNDSGRKRATTDGPLTVFAPGFAQVDQFAAGAEGRHFAGFRFQINPFEQGQLCNVDTEGAFRSFVALEGFFEACVVPFGNEFCDTDPLLEQCTCVREFCRVNAPSSPDDVQQYQCQPV